MRHKHLGRIPRCKLLTGKAYHGRCASKRNWFYGLKMQVVTTSGGIPVEFHLHAGGESEQAGRRGLALNLLDGSVLYTNAGYTDYVAETLFNEVSSSQQQTARKKIANAYIIRSKHLYFSSFVKASKPALVSSKLTFPSRFTSSRPRGLP